MNEVQTSNLIEKDFKSTVLNIPRAKGNNEQRAEGHQKNNVSTEYQLRDTNAKRKPKNKNHTSYKKLITEMKNSVEGFSIIFEQTLRKKNQ